MVKEYVIRSSVKIVAAVVLLLGWSGNAAGERVSFEMLEAPGQGHWADFSLSRDGRHMGCLLDGAVYWWTAEGGFHHLDRGPIAQGGVGMAGDGGSLIAAKAHGRGTRPAIWTRDGSSVDLGILPGDCPQEHHADCGFDLSADGTTAVGQTSSCRGQTAFVWTPRDGIKELPTIDTSESGGVAVSAAGNIVVGYCEHPDQNYRRPSLWRDGNGPILFLGDTPAGEALNVSSNGRFVVGQAEMGGLGPQAFFWREGSQPVNLGNLSGRATDTSLAKAVSDDGKVVGWSGDALWGDQEAFIWTRNSGMISLTAYLASRDVKVPQGMVLTAAMDISGNGETVVGICRDQDWKQGYWRIQLDDSFDQLPVVKSKPWQPKPMDHLLPDTLESFQADILNPFPFGKRRYAPAP